ncbi:unnamed protein product [Ceutorhynchus assimilis]|uniref:Ribosomal RNA-processing protein 40 n=1 Tax=Ceutorhynchus assimilis TaxID=467358 RepID=A0A9N9MIW2_9CUCU|nr:unnamed protein product [Ceutorhynchus assimilis]
MSAITTIDYLLPGEIVDNLKSKDRHTIIGPGLRRNEENPNKSLIVTQAGWLRFRSPNTYWIDSRRNRYIPKKGDLVIGIVTKKSGDIVRVDIGSAETASLSVFSFEGATKKMRPDLNIGDIVYAKLLTAHKDMEPELVCIDQYFRAGRLGILSNDGFLVCLNLNLAETLLNAENPLLRTLGKKFPYEIVIGVNGRAWIKANQAKDVLTICKTFEVAKNESEKSIIEACRQTK